MFTPKEKTKKFLTKKISNKYEQNERIKNLSLKQNLYEKKKIHSTQPMIKLYRPNVISNNEKKTSSQHSFSKFFVSQCLNLCSDVEFSSNKSVYNYGESRNTIKYFDDEDQKNSKKLTPQTQPQIQERQNYSINPENQCSRNYRINSLIIRDLDHNKNLQLLILKPPSIIVEEPLQSVRTIIDNLKDFDETIKQQKNSSKFEDENKKKCSKMDKVTVILRKNPQIQFHNKQ